MVAKCEPAIAHAFCLGVLLYVGWCWWIWLSAGGAVLHTGPQVLCHHVWVWICWQRLVVSVACILGSGSVSGAVRCRWDGVLTGGFIG